MEASLCISATQWLKMPSFYPVCSDSTGGVLGPHGEREKTTNYNNSVNWLMRMNNKTIAKSWFH